MTYNFTDLINRFASPDAKEEMRAVLVRIGTSQAIEMSGKLTMGPEIPLPTKRDNPE